MPKSIPLWTNAVDGLAAPRAASSSLSLAHLLHCDASDEGECWQEVLLASYMTDFPWLLQTAPQLLALKGQLVVLSGMKDTATVDVVRTPDKDGRESVVYQHKSRAALEKNAWLHVAGPLLAGKVKADRFVVIEPPLPFPYGTHHTKMLLAVNARGIRVAIFTANFLHADWHYKSQAIFVQDFPRKEVTPKTAVSGKGADSSTSHPTSSGETFKTELHRYLQRCGLASRTMPPPLTPDASTVTSPVVRFFGAADSLDAFDFSSARVDLVASAPGNYGSSAWATTGAFGMDRLSALVGLTAADGAARQVTPPPSSRITLSWQYSSQGTLRDRFLQELQLAMTPPGCGLADVRVVYPTEAEVRRSIEGWRGGLALPLRMELCHPFINARLHRWGTTKRALDENADAAKRQRCEDTPTAVVSVDSAGRDDQSVVASVAWQEQALPHLKTYGALQEDGHPVWFLLTSVNLSQAAWGTPSGSSTATRRLLIRSYELGVFYTSRSCVDVDEEGCPTDPSIYTVTPRQPIKFPCPANSRHLFPIEYPPVGDSAGATMYLPYNLARPIPYASTAALRSAEDTHREDRLSAAALSTEDIPWVVDMPHRGLDSLGKTVNAAVKDYCCYGEKSWFAPTAAFAEC